MAVFQFRARNAKTGAGIAAEIILGGERRGSTPKEKDKYLLVETKSSGTFSWSANYGGKRLDSGSSSGGKIEILYEPES
ncbi:hypothetical protein AGMMS50225_05260 [Betaproteobacteria bacterium]|nr:hypothetical protein AGMMS50225_05260 [Betaproteobacteria bacterium]